MRKEYDSRGFLLNWICWCYKLHTKEDKYCRVCKDSHHRNANQIPKWEKIQWENRPKWAKHVSDKPFSVIPR